MFNHQHRKFTFFDLNEKIKTCSLLSSVTLKVINVIRSNFDSCRLKDRTSWEKYKNVICGAISVSSYGLIELLSILRKYAFFACLRMYLDRSTSSYNSCA